MSIFEEVAGIGPEQPFSADCFLEFLRRSNERWWPQEQSFTESPWVFRGHRDARWQLIPSAARPLELNPLKSIIERIGRLPDAKPNNGENQLQPAEGPAREQLLLMEAQKLVMRRFLSLSRELGFPADELPKRDAMSVGCIPLLPPEDSAGREWPLDQYGLGTNVGARLRTDSNSMALAQHHRIPTFLLDWTADPLAAAYFAASHNDGTDLAVWAFNTDAIDSNAYYGARSSHDLPKLMLFRPSTLYNPYLKAQKGIFSWVMNAGGYHAARGVYPSIEDLFGQIDLERIREAQSPDRPNASNEQAALDWFPSNSPCLQKIVLRGNEVQKLRELLRREGISKAHLMPTLDNVSHTAMQASKDLCGG